MKQNNRQGGSVVAFLVVGIILAGLALGAIYGVRQFMASQRLIPIADSDKVGDSSSDGTASDGVRREPSQTDNSGNSGVSDSIDETPSTDQSTTGETQINGNLPKSGPATGIIDIAGLSLTAGMVVVYVNSRRTAL